MSQQIKDEIELQQHLLTSPANSSHVPLATHQSNNDLNFDIQYNDNLQENQKPQGMIHTYGSSSHFYNQQNMQTYLNQQDSFKTQTTLENINYQNNYQQDGALQQQFISPLKQNYQEDTTFKNSGGKNGPNQNSQMINVKASKNGQYANLNNKAPSEATLFKTESDSIKRIDKDLGIKNLNIVHSSNNLLEAQQNPQQNYSNKKGLLSSGTSSIQKSTSNNNGQGSKNQKFNNSYNYANINPSGGQQSIIVKESFHTLRLSENQSNQSQLQKPVDHTYILLAILASLFNSCGQIIRGYESENIVASNFMQNATFCIIPFIYVILRKFKAKRQNTTFIMPWYQEIPKHQQQIPQSNLVYSNPLPHPLINDHNHPDTKHYRFSLKIFIVLILGGACEFVGCYFLVCSFHYGQMAMMNDGISSSLILFSSVYILSMQYLIYKDRINIVQAFGIFTILVAVVIVSVFRPDTENISEQTHIHNQTNEEIQQTPQNSQTYYKFLCILTGLIAAVLFGQEIVFVRTLTGYKVDGELAGYIYPLIVGLMGIIGIILYYIISDTASDNYKLSDYLIILCGGLSESTGMVLQIIASSRGVGGIAFSLANTCCIFVTLFNYFIFAQPIGFMQVVGIIMSVLGASIISLDDKIYAFVNRGKAKQHLQTDNSQNSLIIKL
eukprot:403351323